MTEQEFETAKREQVEELERRLGSVVAEHFGADAMEPFLKGILEMDQAEYESWLNVDKRLMDELVPAVWMGLDPITEEGQRIAYLHRQWITLHGKLPYTPQAHRQVGELGAVEGRFVSRYERQVPGCALFLRDAIRAYAKSLWYGQW